MLVKKGRFNAIALSVVVHAIVFYLLLQTVDLSSNKPTNTDNIIKSYVYVAPPVKPIPPSREILPVEAEGMHKKSIDTKQPDKSANQLSTEHQTQEQDIAPLSKAPSASNTPEDSINLNDIRPPKSVIKASSISERAFRQLGQLNRQLTENTIEQEITEHFRHKSPSVLDGKPDLVPHSTAVVTDEEVKLKNTTQYADGLNLIKGENGICTIEQDLSSVGIEGVTAISGFSCGESKFDANFRSHMKNVLKKLGK